ncbi:MAG: type I pullulanase [Erysipelotrichaceae bacterium]|nr:type I pullulanase [Erysipelotrichaceae bacterium]
MKNNVLIKITMIALLLVSLFGCKAKQQTVSYPDRDVDYPTQVEKLEEDSIQIHYQRSDNKYSDWTLWLWDPEGTDDSKEDDFNYQDDYGVIASYPLSYFGELSGGRLGLIVKKKGSWTKDGSESDRFIVFSSYQKDENDVYHVYLAGGDEHIYDSTEKTISDVIYSAAFKDEHSINISCSNPIETYVLYCNGQPVLEGNGAGRKNLTDKLDLTADFSQSYSVEVEFRGSGIRIESPVSMTGLYNSDSFNELYYYDGKLGALYSKDATVFKVWSPVSERIELRIYDNGTPERISDQGSDTFISYEMEKEEKGVFSYTCSGDMEGKYYTYVVYNGTYPDGYEIVDPYARSAGINGVRGMVVDFSKTDPEGWDKIDYLKYDRKELTVWETHVADVTSSDTWNGPAEHKRRFLGLIDEGTTYTEGGMTVTTGFDHFRELGINALQLIPIYDQDNDETEYSFNWGYNPLNCNVLEGLYSSDPYDGYSRIREFKQVVKRFNEAGITIIMDVVYNHVSSALHSSFDVLMPGYYFRYNYDGSFSNGSGCGNETASEMPMMRKFMIDSVCFWTEEYKLGGFRFDLMGLHDIETMDQISAAVGRINPYAVIYGEPWTGGKTPLNIDDQAIQANANRFKGYGQFNDQMRDALIKGGLNAPNATGWINSSQISSSDVSAIQKGINGCTYNLAYSIDDPDKSVSYVTCHDNFTLYDRMKAAGIEDEETIRKMCVLAQAVVLTSDGTSFLLAGEEMLRTKQGDSNSYQSSDEINQLDYSLKIRNHDVFENIRQLVTFKKDNAQLHAKDPDIEVEVMENGAVLKYELKSGSNVYVVYHANGLCRNTTIEEEGCTVFLDTLDLYEGDAEGLQLQPYQTLILIR